jgi:hypothetical protein
MAIDCPTCEESFESAEGKSAAQQVASHVVSESRTDPRHRTWLDTNTERGTTGEVVDYLAD